jgi:light-regulated signal transduction histidine kinase (bacteriophytochrome)
MKIEIANSTKMMRATDTILENLLDAVLVVNDSGNIIYANQSAQNLFCKSAIELVGQPFGFPIIPYEVQEIQVLKDSEILTVQMLASHIPWDGQKASLLSLRDITAQKQVQEELDRQRKILEKTSEENAQYASLASHDLKEPVRKIMMYSDRLLHKGNLEENEKEQIRKIQSCAKRMHSLINGIAELSRINHVRHVFKPIDLNVTVEEVCTDLEFQIEEKNAIVEVGELPVIDGMLDEMYQLFLNLISNSLKYSTQEKRPYIQIHQKPTDDGHVCIECIDNGIGFDNEMAKKLFQPFQRLHTTKYEGMGVGLTLCQKIVDVHKGEITAKGKPGEGATFTVRLPKHHVTAG